MKTINELLKGKAHTTTVELYLNANDLEKTEVTYVTAGTAGGGLPAMGEWNNVYGIEAANAMRKAYLYVCKHKPDAKGFLHDGTMSAVVPKVRVQGDVVISRAFNLPRFLRMTNNGTDLQLVNDFLEVVPGYSPTKDAEAMLKEIESIEHKMELFGCKNLAQMKDKLNAYLNPAVEVEQLKAV